MTHSFPQGPALRCVSLLLIGALLASITPRPAAAGRPASTKRVDAPSPFGPSQKKATRPPGLWRSASHNHARAGHPQRIAWYAKPSRSPWDAFGFVGGNAAGRGEPRCVDEGTWGLDAGGLFGKRRVWLQWLHGRPSHQEGGSYEPDGPHLAW